MRKLDSREEMIEISDCLGSLIKHRIQLIPLIEEFAQDGFIELDKRQVKLLKKPCVYFCFSSGKLMYIGSSCNGAQRYLGNNHFQISHLPEPHIVVVPINCHKDALLLEKILIKKFNPSWNTHYKPKMN